MSRIERNKKYLRDLYAGPFPGHALIYQPPLGATGGELGDFTLSDRPVADWVPWYVWSYRETCRLSDELDDDNVPFANLNTNTGIFAAAFGCELQKFEGSNAAARPCVADAAGARTLPEPSLDAPTLSRILELARLLRSELGDDVPISVPDIQSPFDIAAIVWEKADLFTALVLAPDDVMELVDKSHRLLVGFLDEFRRTVPACSMAHCPYTWGPADLGIWLSEDEVGAFGTDMFDQFCLPSLVALSQYYGGMFLHCCADADHQYEGFAKIPNLRMLNRRFIRGPQACIERFPGVVIAMGHTPEEQLNELLDLARPQTRYLFCIGGMKPEKARPVFDRLRARMPRLAA